MGKYDSYKQLSGNWCWNLCVDSKNGKVRGGEMVWEKERKVKDYQTFFLWKFRLTVYWALHIIIQSAYHMPDTTQSPCRQSTHFILITTSHGRHCRHHTEQEISNRLFSKSERLAPKQTASTTNAGGLKTTLPSHEALLLIRYCYYRQEPGTVPRLRRDTTVRSHGEPEILIPRSPHHLPRHRNCVLPASQELG